MLENTPLIKIIYLVFVLIIFCLRLQTIKSNKKMEKIKGTVYATWTHKILFVLYFTIFFTSIFEFYMLRKNINIIVFVVGMAMVIFGFNARRWAVNALGKYWSNNIEIREKHPVIREGPYKYIRHPNYLFLTMEFLGLAMAGNAYWTMIFLFIAYFPVIISRIIIEERKMIESLGQAYLDYKKEVPAFIPWKWKV